MLARWKNPGSSQAARCGAPATAPFPPAATRPRPAPPSRCCPASAARIAGSVAALHHHDGEGPRDEGEGRDADGAALRHRADPPRAALEPGAGLDSRVPVRRGGEHECLHGERGRRQDRAAAAPADASGEGHRYADRAVDRPFPARRAADRSAPRRGRRPLPDERRQHDRPGSGARLARAAFFGPMTPERLRALVGEIIVRAGMVEDNARTVADVLVWAELRGRGSHGVMRVPRYVEWMRRGDLNGHPDIITRESGATITVDDVRMAI